MKTVAVQHGQSAYDVCNAVYGTQDLLVKFCVDNGIADANAPLPIAVAVYDETLVSLQGVRGGYATLVTPGTCSIITGLSVDGITDEQATFTWDSTPSLRYEYAINDTGATPTAWTQTGSTARTISGLDAATEYHFFVRAVCGSTPTSITFETLP